MQRDDPLDTPAAPAAPRRASAWPTHALPGALAALLFLALALGAGVLGAAAAPLQGALAVALAASVAARPASRAALARAAAHPLLPHYAALAGVAALAAFLRTWGLRFGLPYLEHPDEWAVADEAVRMLRTGDYRPTKWDYPTLAMYLQAGVAGVHFLWGVGAGLYRGLGDLQPQHYYVWMRALTAALGVGSVLLTYALGSRLYGRAAALAGAALLAVMPVAVGDAHYVTTDTPAMFFTLLAFLAIVRLALADAAPESGPWPPAGRALLAGLAVGLAAATKYNVAALVVALGLAVAMAACRRGALGAWPAAALAALGIVAGFTLGMPLWLAELRNVLNGLASIVLHYRVDGHPGAESSRPALFYWGALANDGLLAAAAMLAGLLLAFVRRSRADLLVLAFVAPSILQLTGVRVVFFRNVMPLLPLLCLLAGAALAALSAAALARGGGGTSRPAPRLRALVLRPGLLLTAMVAVVAAEPLATSFHDEQLRARPTTRVLATAWVEANAPTGARIWLEDATLTLPARLRAQGGRPITSNPPAWYRENGFRFLVALMDRDDKDGALLAAFGEPAVRFERAGERHGPTLAIWDTGAGDVSRDPRTPSGATLGGGALALEGYRHPAEVRAGAVLPLALYWQAARQLPADYTVFVHLLDAQGGKAAQRDTPPLDGSRPTGTWLPGELIRDDQDLAVPATVPPGTYRLVAGMYDPTTLAAITDSGPIDLGEVVVVP